MTTVAEAADPRLGRAWVALTIALTAHVADEALTGFLDVYNPIVRSMRDRVGWFPMPTFTFEVWIAGLCAAVAALFALAPLAYRRSPFIRIAVYPYAMSRTAGLCAMMAVAAMACSTIAPVRITAGDQCFQCRRTIDDTRLAAERVTGFVEKFKAPGCMAKYIVAHPDETGPIFVTDFATDRMVTPDQAFFVPFTLNAVTGETDYRAYLAKADADKAAFELHTVPVTWQTVLDRAKQAL